MNTSRKTGLLRLAHLREVNEARAEEHDLHRERFERLKNPDSAPRAVSSFNLFQTPEPIADRMAAMADLSGRVLEPSAGLGRLYRAIRCRSSCPVVLVENSPTCAAELYRETSGDNQAELVQADFLNCSAARLGSVDCVVMNPPFKMGRDVRHITHALTLLQPGGLLVALCFNGSRQNAKLKPLADTWEVLPAGSFKSEGTRAEVVLMTVRKS